MRSLLHRSTKLLTKLAVRFERTRDVFFAGLCIVCVATIFLSATGQPDSKKSFPSSSDDATTMFTDQLPDSPISWTRRSERKEFDSSESSLWDGVHCFADWIQNPIFKQRYRWQRIQTASRPLRILNCQLNI